jgi:thiol-disulfide isomerase/thioredoxin
MKTLNPLPSANGVVSRIRFVSGAILAVVAVLLLAPSRGFAQESSVPPTASLLPVLRSGNWINGKPASGNLAGKVVLVDVFTFDCYNCKNITPNLRSLAAAGHADLAIIGIHTPETNYERDRNQVVRHLETLGVTWPVAVDNDYALWKAYGVEYWPTQMIFDRRGRLRKVVIGDSQDAVVNAEITSLLREHA